MGTEKEDDGQEMTSLDEGSLVPALAIEMPNENVGQTSSKKGGGWVTAPFILGSSLASTVASYGVTINLLQFLVRRFNISNIRASQITNIINSVTCLSPVAGAVLCDSYLGCFLTISVFTLISFLGTLMLALAASLPSMAPPSCDHELGSCQSPTPTQFVFLCLAFSVTTLGLAGTCFTYVTMGANQFDRKKEQERFVSYYFLTTTVSMLVPSTVIVYVMDNVGWNWGYGLCAVLSAISVALFVPIKWFCRDARPEGSPFINLARVVVSAARKIKLKLSVKQEDYYHGSGMLSELTSRFRYSSKRHHEPLALL